MEHIHWSRAKRDNRVEMDDIFPSVLQVEILKKKKKKKKKEFECISISVVIVLIPSFLLTRFDLALFLPHMFRSSSGGFHAHQLTTETSLALQGLKWLPTTKSYGYTLICILGPFWNMYFGMHPLDFLSIWLIWYHTFMILLFLFVLSLLCQVFILHLTLPRSNIIGSFLSPLQLFSRKIHPVHLSHYYS